MRKTIFLAVLSILFLSGNAVSTTTFIVGNDDTSDSEASIEDAIRGTEYTPSYNGSIEKIGCYVHGTYVGYKINLGVYWKNNMTLLYETGNNTEGTTGYENLEFDVPNGYNIKKDTEYIIVAWDDSSINLCYESGTGTGYYNSSVYNGSYPNTISMSTSTRNYRIWIECDNTEPTLSSPTVEPSTGWEGNTSYFFNVTASDSLDNFTVYSRAWYGSTIFNNSMNYVSGHNTTGADYTFSRTLPNPGVWSYQFLCYDGLQWSASSTYSMTVWANTSFQVNFPTYIEVGDYLWTRGSLQTGSGAPLNNTWVTTSIKDSNDMSTVPNSEMSYYVDQGRYDYVFSTSTMTPGKYYIWVNYTLYGHDYSTNRTFYLSNSSGPGHYSTKVFFNFYDSNKGTGLPPNLFKIYVGESSTLSADDRIYGNSYKTYTGETLYYRIDDYFDNQVYPTVGTYDSFTVAEIEQYVDIPITWYDVAVKNLNNSIMFFSMENSGVFYNQTLFPGDTVHINVLSGNYNITKIFYSSMNGSVEKTVNDSVSISSDGFYIATGFDAMVHFSWYNTNEALGLPDETLKLYIDGNRQTSQTFWTYINKTINVTIKDYYNQTLYQGNHTLNTTYTFLDFGLTFHSWKFNNKNDDYYMLSFLKDGGSRWFERGICPYETVEFLLPSGDYRMRIYDKDDVEIHNTTYELRNSRVYLIHGTNLSEIISGQSVIQGQLLELQSELDTALMPDDVIWSTNPVTIFSCFDRIGQNLGNNVWKVCPALNVIAETRVSSTGNWINTTAKIPGNDTTENGTISIIDDTLYISGSGSITWVNITYTDNKTVMQNTTYIPSKINLNGENLTVNASGDINILRETVYSQMKKFYWNVYNSTDNPGHISGRGGFHRTGITVDNPMDVSIYDVYVYAGFSDKTIPDTNTVRVNDLENGVLLEQGEDFKTTGDGIEFKIEGGMSAGTEREFTLSYYKDKAHTYVYEDAQDVIRTYEKGQTLSGYDEFFNKAEIMWVNDNTLAFRGSLRIKFGFDIDLDKNSVKVFDEDKNHLVDNDDLILGDEFIWISSTVMGDVQSGGTRSFSIYFQEQTYPGQSVDEYHLSTPFIKISGFPISFFTVMMIIGLICTFSGLGMILKTRRLKDSYTFFLLLGIGISFIFWILQAKGV